MVVSKRVGVVLMARRKSGQVKGKRGGGRILSSMV